MSELKWTSKPPPHKRPKEGYHFLTATWVDHWARGMWEIDVWEVCWSDDGYWMLLDNDEEYGCLQDDFPTADYYAVLPMPPRPRPKGD